MTHNDVELPPGTINLIAVHDSMRDWSLPMLNLGDDTKNYRKDSMIPQRIIRTIASKGAI